jgi:hypothetical protein
MRRMIIGPLVYAIVTCSYANAGIAQVAEPVPGTAYPDRQCTKPELKLIKPPKLNDAGDAGEVVAYNARARACNSEMKAFNQTSATYRSCVQIYVENASREVKRIQDQTNADLKRITENGNAAIDAIQDKIKRATAGLNDLVRDEENSTAALRTGH